MQKKISRIVQSCFIIIVLMLTIISSVISQGRIVNTNFSNQTEEILAPTWKKNDTWTYFADIDTIFNETEFSIICNDLLVEIVDLDEQTYKIHFSGDITGNGQLPEYGEINQLIGTIEGYIDLYKCNLSFKEIYSSIIEGRAQIKTDSLPVIVDFEVTLDSIKTSPTINRLSFPLFVGKNWTTQPSDLEIHGEIKVETEHQEMNDTKHSVIPANFFNCTNITSFYLSKYGLYVDAYNISEELNNQRNIMYSPDISSIVSTSCRNLEMGNLTLSSELYLKNTSYINETYELSIDLAKPKEKSLYIFNNSIDIFKPITTIIIGEIELEAVVEDEISNVNVSFYMDDEHKITLNTPPYKYILDEIMFLKDTHKISVVAKDELGRQDEDYIYVKILNLGIY